MQQVWGRGGQGWKVLFGRAELGVSLLTQSWSPRPRELPGPPPCIGGRTEGRCRCGVHTAAEPGCTPCLRVRGSALPSAAAQHSHCRWKAGTRPASKTTPFLRSQRNRRKQQEQGTGGPPQATRVPHNTFRSRRTQGAGSDPPAGTGIFPLLGGSTRS